VDHAWKKSSGQSEALVRFINLPDTGHFWLYSIPAQDGSFLSLLYEEDTSVGMMRAQARDLTRLLDKP
jgi:hypothetical protein